MSPAYREHAAGFADLDWADRTKVIRFMLQEMRIIGGSAHPFDQGLATRLLERDYDRARNFASATNHFKLKGGEAWQGPAGRDPRHRCLSSTAQRIRYFRSSTVVR